MSARRAKLSCSSSSPRCIWCSTLSPWRLIHRSRIWHRRRAYLKIYYNVECLCLTTHCYGNGWLYVTYNILIHNAPAAMIKQRLLHTVHMYKSINACMHILWLVYILYTTLWTPHEPVRATQTVGLSFQTHHLYSLTRGCRLWHTYPPSCFTTFIKCPCGEREEQQVKAAWENGWFCLMFNKSSK